MREVRDIVALGLDARVKAGIKVRQPLETLKTTVSFSGVVVSGFNSTIKAELNVKNVLFGQTELKEKVWLDTEITPALKEEGMVREFIRQVQDLRKKENLHPADKNRTLLVSADDRGKKFIQKFETEIKKATLFAAIEYREEKIGQSAGDGGNNMFAISISPR